LKVNGKYLTVTFFVFLTLSIVIISVNSMIKSAYAQSTTLDQKGNSQSSQTKEQLQSSNQDNQVVSGEESIFSGDNVLCQNPDDSKILDVICNSGQLQGGNSNLIPLQLTVLNSGGFRYDLTVLSFDKNGTLLDSIDHKSIDRGINVFDYLNSQTTSFKIKIEAGDRISVRNVEWIYAVSNPRVAPDILGPGVARDRCSSENDELWTCTSYSFEPNSRGIIVQMWTSTSHG
jgi:hypothetical protein